MAKPSSNAAPSFKAIPFKAPPPAPGTRRAAANENFPVPVYLVMRTDWRFSKRSGRHQQQTTTVVSAFTTQLPAQEAALIAFEKFVDEYHYAGERSVENRFSWYSWWNGRNKAHYRDVKEIAEDMKTWPSKWKAGTAEERYEKMVEAMEAVKSRLPSGSVFNVEKASLPPAARARAVNCSNPAPFRIFALTENHWSWSKSVDVTTVLGIFTCLNQARVEGVDAYHAYIHSSHQERKRLRWDKTANNAYDKMLKNVLADKVTWEKTSREYGTSFSIDECYCYPRGAYFRYQDEVLPKADQDLNFPKPRAGDSSTRSSVPPPVSTRTPAAVPQPVEQVTRPRVVSFAPPPAPIVQKEKPYIPVVQSTDQDGPRAYGFIRRTYAVNPERKQEDRIRNQGIEVGSAGGSEKKGILPTTRGSHPRGLVRERVGFHDRVKERGRDKSGGSSSSRFEPSIRSAGSTRFASRHVASDEEERGTRHGEGQGDEDGGLKRRKPWNDPGPEKGESDTSATHRGQDVAQEWAEARARARARRAYVQEKDLGENREGGDLSEEKENLEREGVHRDDEIPAHSENVVYHRAYAYVARDKTPKDVLDERKDELTSEGERADDEVSVQTVVHRRVHQQRRIDEEAEVQYTSEGYDVEDDDCEVGVSRSNVKSREELDEEILSVVDDERGEACDVEIHLDGDACLPDDDVVEKSEMEVDGAPSEVDDQPNRLASEREEAASLSEAHYNPFAGPSENEKAEEGNGGAHYNPFDDSLEKGNAEREQSREGDHNPFDTPVNVGRSEGEAEEVCVAEVLDEPEDPPLVRKPRRANDKVSKYLDDQLKCLFSGEGCEDENESKGYGYQSEDTSSVLNSGTSEQPHSRNTHNWPERPLMSSGYGDKGHSKRNDDLQEDRVPMKEARDIEEVMIEPAEDHRGYGFTFVGYEDVYHAEGEDPPLIRKPRDRKKLRSKGDAYHPNNRRDCDFTSAGFESAGSVKRDDPEVISKATEKAGIRSKEDDRFKKQTSRREIHQQSDHRNYHFASRGHESSSHAKRDEFPSSKTHGVQEDVPSKGEKDELRGEAQKRRPHHRTEAFADCEGEQLEESSVEEQTVGPRKEAPHLDLVLKRHRAVLKEDEESSEQEFGGRRPVGGGFKIPS